MLHDAYPEEQEGAKPPDMSVTELVGQAETLRREGRREAMLALYRAWTNGHPGHPMLYVVFFNYGAALTQEGRLEDARQAFEKAIELNPAFAPSYINLGRLWERAGRMNEALINWNKALNVLAPVTGMSLSHKTTLLNQMARVLEAAGRDTEAEAMLRQSLELDPDQRDVIQHYLATRQRLCDWPVVKPVDRADAEVLMKGMSPLSAAIHTDDPMFQLSCNACYNAKDIGDPDDAIHPCRAAYENGKKDGALKIGYVSSDLREHAVGFLMSEVFGLHNREKVEVYVYYCGIDAEDATMRRIKATVDHWTPINAMSDEEAARRIEDDGIQILVDLNGYTRDARAKVIARRPAPVIVNWLGFPGSAGSAYHHYLIADDWIIPKKNEIYFSEKILRLPCYQPNDRKRVLSDKKPTRADAGLPPEATVFCCFNGTQKLTKPMFDLWLTVLMRVPQSVLWLLGGNEDTQDRLRTYAGQHGVEAGRIVFAARKPNAEHLARYPLADLFLDTFPYGAHTTASDALWMGVPVLTLSGKSFASRVCGSLVRAAGFPDLVCSTPEEYVGRAIALGNDKKALGRYKEKLVTTRDTCLLFDTPRLVNKLEGLYETMWKACEGGKLPTPDLRNMDVYGTLASKQDYDRLKHMDDESYRMWWGRLLKKRHALRPIYPDARLWASEVCGVRRKKA
ncbi:MAG: tetratricopeptide repeat protein [Alphaproteobacteria bacterium]|nr:tetratricopeptide repeat protein [Alphaproteobacteria bacterium]